MKILQDILYVVIIAILPIVVSKFVTFVSGKTTSLEAGLKNEKQKKLLEAINELFVAAVTKTNQTFVDNVKAAGKWDETAASKAFELSKETVQSLLTSDAKDLLAELYKDVDSWIDTKIESTVKALKK